MSLKQTPPSTYISLPIGTNDKPLAAIGKFASAIGKLMMGKTLATNREEITNAMIGNNVLANYWLSLVDGLCKALGKIGNDW